MCKLLQFRLYSSIKIRNKKAILFLPHFNIPQQKRGLQTAAFIVFHSFIYKHETNMGT